MRNQWLIFLASLFLFLQPLSAKVRLITFHYNKPEFIELQDKALKKFMLNDYELIVFNDARDPTMAENITATCDRLGIQCVRFEQEWHAVDSINEYISAICNIPGVHSHISFGSFDPKVIGDQASVRHCHVIQYALDHYGYNHNDIVAIMDGDIFMIRPFDLKKEMKKCRMIGIYKFFSEWNVGYFWVPFVAMNMPRIPAKDDLKFHVDLIGKYVFDTGAHSYFYLKNHPEVRTKKYSWVSSSSFSDKPISELIAAGFNQAEIEFINERPWPSSVEFHINHHFLHFGASSFGLWDHNSKTEHVISFINKICAD